MTPAEARRQHAAARSLAHTQRLENRSAKATAILAAVLGADSAATVPGYRVTRDSHGLRVAALPAIDAAQLALGLEIAS